MGVKVGPVRARRCRRTIRVATRRRHRRRPLLGGNLGGVLGGERISRRGRELRDVGAIALHRVCSIKVIALFELCKRTPGFLAREGPVEYHGAYTDIPGRLATLLTRLRPTVRPIGWLRADAVG